MELEKETKTSLWLYEGGKKQAFVCTCPKKMPPLPSEHRGWNAGKGNCGITIAT